MNPRDRKLWLDWQASLYLEALEKQDFEPQETLWALAAHDEELEAAFHETHEAILHEREAEVSASIASAAEMHLTSGEVLKSKTGPVTVADVAEELFKHTPDRLDAEAHALNEKLRNRTEPIPVDLGVSSLSTWAESLFGSAGREYLIAFRQAAMKLQGQRASETEYQLAARQTKKPGDKQ